MGPKLLLITNRKSHTPFRLVQKINDLGWPWTADTHSVAEKMRISKPTTKIWMKIDLYYQRQQCRPIVCGGIRCTRIFAEVPWGGSVKRQWGCGKRQISPFSLAIFRILQRWLRWGQLYYTAIRSPSSAFQWSQSAYLEWPWMTLNGYFALNSVFAPVWLAETVRH